MLILYPILITLNIALGLIPLIKGKKSRLISNLSFSLSCFALSYWMFSCYFLWTTENMLFWVRHAFVGPSLLPIPLLVFIYSYPKKTTKYISIKWGIFAVAGIIFAILSLTNFIVIDMKSMTDVTFNYGHNLFSLYFLGGIATVLYKAIKGILDYDGLDKEKLIYFSVGLITTLVFGALFNLILPMLGISQYTYLGPLFISFLVVFSFISIIKHELLEIKVVITKAASYFIGGAIILCSFIFLYSLPIKIENKLGMIAAIGIFWGLLGERIRFWIQKPLDRKILHETYDIAETIKKISKKLTKALEFEYAILSIINAIGDVIPFSHHQAYLYTEEKKAYHYKTFLAHAESSLYLPNDSAIIRYFEENQELSFIQNIPSDILAEMPKEQSGMIEIIVPLYSDKELCGLLLLGQKTMNGGYTSYDIEFFSKMIKALRPILERIVLHEIAQKRTLSLMKEREKTKKELKKHIEDKNNLEKEYELSGEIQRSLLPETVPSITNYIFDAEFIPAKKISGDYYQFFQFSEEETGIFIADVAGKGVVASYVMFVVHALVSKSIDAKSSPKEITENLNNLFYRNKSIPKQVPFVYAKLNNKYNTFTYCNAGHEPPIYIGKGKVSSLESTGFFGGASENEEYDEEKIELNDGDAILLFTDGLTDAEGKDGNKYDIERVKSICKAYAQGGVFEKRLFQLVMEDWDKLIKDDGELKDDLAFIGIEHRKAKYLT
jgi:serine phosphatase RsbU (regulator of sigma subunit)